MKIAKIMVDFEWLVSFGATKYAFQDFKRMRWYAIHAQTVD